MRSVIMKMTTIIHCREGLDFSSAWDLPRQMMTHEWYGRELRKPIMFSFALSEGFLWFVMEHAEKPLIDPKAKPGMFKEELWKYDTAEFFLYDENTDVYYEFNLGSEGAWWMAEFPKVLELSEDFGIPEGVETMGEYGEWGWRCAARVPLSAFRRVNEGFLTKDAVRQGIRLSACAIVESPDYVFVTTNSDCSGVPKFHRPYAFSETQIRWD